MILEPMLCRFNSVCDLHPVLMFVLIDIHIGVVTGPLHKKLYRCLEFFTFIGKCVTIIYS